MANHYYLYAGPLQRLSAAAEMAYLQSEKENRQFSASRRRKLSRDCLDFLGNVFRNLAEAPGAPEAALRALAAALDNRSNLDCFSSLRGTNHAAVNPGGFLNRSNDRRIYVGGLAFGATGFQRQFVSMTNDNQVRHYVGALQFAYYHPRAAGWVPEFEAADRNLNAVAFGHADLLRSGGLSPSTLSARIRKEVCKN